MFIQLTMQNNDLIASLLIKYFIIIIILWTLNSSCSVHESLYYSDSETSKINNNLTIII